MSLLKPITLLLVAAIANPMCCCLSFADMDLEASPKTSDSAHACCLLTKESAQSEQSAPSGDHDCFHEEIEGAQYSDNTGFSTTISTGVSQQVVEFVDASSIYTTPRLIALIDSSSGLDPYRREAGISYSQKYFIFTL